MKKDKEILFSKIEPVVDDFHKSLAIFKRPRNLALIHLLRHFEDRVRFRTTRALLEHGQVTFLVALQNAQDALVWGTRWIWEECVASDQDDLSLDSAVYEEAASLFSHSGDYYHLYRCFVLCRRGRFDAEVDLPAKKIRFSYESTSDEPLDAARQLRETTQDATIQASNTLQVFLSTWAPVLQELVPACTQKVDEHSVKYDLPRLVSWVFARWAGLQSIQMRFDLPETWQFGDYNLSDFRSFWKSLLAASIAHNFVHMLGDSRVGTSGLTVGSVVMQLSTEQLQQICDKFPIPAKARDAIIEALTYAPLKKDGYWDPIWQPLFCIGGGHYLLSPNLIIGSSAERNLMILLNKSEQTQQMYSKVSLEKESGQLTEIEKLLGSDRFVSRRCVSVSRANGTKLTDVDLLVFDRSERTAIAIQVKWLIRPDFVTEVSAKDDEVQAALSVSTETVARLRELGNQWLSQVLKVETGNEVAVIGALVVNRDFLPSGWIKDEEIPIVDGSFMRDFIGSKEFSGLKSLRQAAMELDKSLVAKHSFKKSSEVVRLGEYSFEMPTIEDIEK